MDRRLLHFYNIELQHLRETAGEFAREYPKIAGRLALDKEGKEICPDPFVERLLEGFAYLAARIHLKLDAEFPRLTQALLETIQPAYLAPTPSMAIVRFEPDLANKALASGFTVPRGTALRNFGGQRDQTPCTYCTAHAVTLWPIQLAAADYLVRNIALLALPGQSLPEAALRLTLKAGPEILFSSLALEKLTFFLRGTDEMPTRILEHLFAQGVSLWVRSGGKKTSSWYPLPLSCLRLVGMAQDETHIPDVVSSFEGYRLLMEYFAFPQRFLFFEVSGLKELMQNFASDSLEIAISMRDENLDLEDRVNGSMFDLFCTPVINLFEKRTDRIPLTSRFAEFHVVVDRTRPLDYEIFSVNAVTGYGDDSPEQETFHPFYLSRDTSSATTGFFTVNRTPRTLTEKERKFGSISSYSGSEVYLSLVDSAAAPFNSRLHQLGVTVTCTNRHLPLRMSRSDGSADFLVEFNGPVRAARCVAGPTAPRPSFAMGETAWRLISQLSLNYFSVTDTAGKEGASALRDLLCLYVDPNDRHLTKQIDSIRSIHSTPILRRIPTPGVITFGRGLEISVLFDEDAFAGSGVFVLGLVLEHFFGQQVTINSFTETTISSKQRGEIMRWPARTGKRQIL